VEEGREGGKEGRREGEFIDIWRDVRDEERKDGRGNQ